MSCSTSRVQDKAAVHQVFIPGYLLAGQPAVSCLCLSLASVCWASLCHSCLLQYLAKSCVLPGCVPGYTGMCGSFPRKDSRKAVCQILKKRPIVSAEEAGETTLVHYGLGHASQRMLKERLFTDATLVVHGREIGVHRAVLATNSPVFKRMFCSPMTEGIMHLCHSYHQPLLSTAFMLATETPVSISPQAAQHH